MHIPSDHRSDAAPSRFNEDANDGPLNDSYQRGWVQNKVWHAWRRWGSGFWYLKLEIYIGMGVSSFPP